MRSRFIVIVLIAGILLFGGIKVGLAQEVDLSAFIAQIQSVLNSLSQQVAALRQQVQDASRTTPVQQSVIIQTPPSYQFATTSTSTPGYATTTGTVDPAKPPLAPTLLSSCGAAPTYACLTWKDNSTNESSFIVERGSSYGGPFTAVGSTAANITTFTNIGLVPNSSYYYRVKAVNTFGSSAYSNVIFVKTPPAGAPPSAPTNFQALPVNSNRIILGWLDVATSTGGYYATSSEDGFSIWRGTFPNSLVSIASTSPNTEGYDDQGGFLQPSTLYYYRVEAFNKFGTSSTPIILVATLATATSTPPFVLNVTLSGNSQAHLNWYDNSTNETGFLINRYVNNVLSFSTTTTANVVGYNDIFSPLSGGTQLKYILYAKSAFGTSTPSNVVQVIVP